ncbi:hypothetical protein [Loigolactobacillus backii]|uniref:hypothetical protein n=1 Tax=Loigolactobacillus backii TaxID=375175 RepID=UPI0007F087D3|nr:hypothetical protein [Loigolactobacillus backii]ANK60047.1 hypothetical protein AYR52_07075 [Loigolactobacillus backii]
MINADKKQLLKIINEKQVYTFDAIKYLSGENNDGKNDSKGFFKLSDDEKVQLIAWILNNLKKVKYYSKYNTSYGIKNIFKKSALGFYVYGGAFKEAMLICGFEVKDVRDENWIFNVSDACCKELNTRYFKNKKEGWQVL